MVAVVIDDERPLLRWRPPEAATVLPRPRLRLVDAGPVSPRPASDGAATDRPATDLSVSGRRTGFSLDDRSTSAGPVRRRRPPSPEVAARRSWVIGIVALALAACGVWSQAGAVGRTGDGPLAVSGAGPSRTAAAEVWVVQPGDTIWSIAERMQPSGDIRPLVDRLAAEVHAQPLQIGERLAIP
jgi:hypothetical protein